MASIIKKPLFQLQKDNRKITIEHCCSTPLAFYGKWMSKMLFFVAILMRLYMWPPWEYFSPSKMVCRLKKSLYGLKQAPWAWFRKFRQAIVKMGFHQSDNDDSLFIKRSSKGCTILLIHVDDIIICGNNDDGICALKENFWHERSMSLVWKLNALFKVFMFINVSMLKISYQWQD